MDVVKHTPLITCHQGWMSCALILILSCTLQLSGFSRGQIDPLSQQLTQDQGLISNTIICLLQDGRGLMWIGTDKGLMSYDGQNFQKISHDLVRNRRVIMAIDESEDGTIWVVATYRLLSASNISQHGICLDASSKTGL
ncbi:MAG: hypothetical protein KC456_08110 [Flavobacteriales bacterium]|nr:hypothetical protein [Flavobacteriales bacterium]